MKLFLAAEAKHPDTFQQITEFVGGSFAGKKVLYIPTAGNAEGWRSWHNSSSFALLKTLDIQLEAVELENTTYEELAEKMKDVDIVWMGGGMVGYLLYWIRRRKFDHLLKNALERGVIYIGSSAGGMACSKTQFLTEWYPNEEEPGVSLIPGLSFVDFEIFPHYQDEQLTFIKEHWKKGTLYLLKNGEAIMVVGGKVTVLGEERKIEK